MGWYKAILIIAIFLSGCESKANLEVSKAVYKNVDVNSTNDFMLIKAFYFLETGDNTQALDSFNELYKNTKNTQYLKEALKIAFTLKDKRLDWLIKEAKANIKNDFEVDRIEIGYYILNSQLKKAKDLAKFLIKKDGKNSLNYSALGTVYIYTNELNLALDAFKKAYELDPNEENLLKLVDILDNKLNNSNGAIIYLKDWVSTHGCTQLSCIALLNIYSSKGNLDGMAKVYEELYKKFHQEVFLQKAFEILLYKKDLNGVKSLLVKYGFNDEALSELYANLGEYSKAYDITQKLYSKTNNPEYLARMAIYKYEQAGSNISDFELSNVIRLFEQSVDLINNPQYLNFYGYLLIDHNIDAKKGLHYALKANTLDPDSSYIMDSIAWGYYKLKKCDKAKIWMQKASKDKDLMLTKDVKEHKEAIDKCLAKKLKGKDK